MNFRLTAALFGTVFVLGLALLALSLWDTADETPSRDLVLAELGGAKADQIDAVELERGDGAKLVLKRAGKDQWAVAEPVAARADSAAVTRVVESLLKLRPTAFGELSANPAVHGLDKPGLRVTLREGDKAATLNVGQVTVGGTKAVGFVTTPTRTRPMAVNRADLDALFKDTGRGGDAGELAKWTNDYRNKAVFTAGAGVGGDDVTAIKLSAKGKDLALSKSGGGWKFDSPAGWGDAATAGDAAGGAITGVRGLINAVVNLQAGAADDFIESPKDLKEYGLDAGNPDRIRVEIKSKDGATEVAYLGKKADAGPPPPPAFPGAPPAPPAGKIYVQIEGQPGVLKANAGPPVEGLAALVADPNPLRDRDLLADADKARVDAVDLTVGGQTTKLRKPAGGEWQLYGGPGDPQPANADAVKKVLDLIAQPRVVKDFPAANDANFAGPELKAEVKLWADGVEAAADPKAEPKLKGTPTVFQFGKRDAAGVYVRRTLPTGAKADFLLPEKVKIGTDPAEADVVATVARPRLDFLDPALKSFAQTRATKLTVSRGATVINEVVADKAAAGAAGDAWKFVQPAPRKDRPADAGTVGNLLTTLATQRAGRFVSEQPAEADLAKWGLDPKTPRLRVEVTLDAGPTPPAGADRNRVFFLGNETDDKQAVYARQEGRAAVFTVPKAVYDQLASADLRDKTVVRFDRAKVKKVTVRGWQKSAGFVTELAFERKDGAWAVAKAPGPYTLDPAKVDRFLDAMNGARVKAFVAGGPKPEYALTPEAGGLQAVLDLDGAPAVTLSIGGPTDGDASLYVQTSTLPPEESVVTVAADPLKAYKDSSAAFAK